ncbi:MAG: response regulator [Silvibacterium sp.]|nr:response regulator [Silvibacterium sp.]
MENSERIVFVVDDEAVIADTLATILNNAGFLATAFYSPESVLSEANGASPDLLITDVAMPGMTGIELAITVKSKHPECKVLLFSGQAGMADLLERARQELPEFEFLPKPVHPTDLLAKISLQDPPE